MSELQTREDTHVRRVRSGEIKKTTMREDRRIMRQVLVDPIVTTSTIQSEVWVPVVAQSTCRRLAEANLNSKSSLRVQSLTLTLK